jgi:hypothetical protein
VDTPWPLEVIGRDGKAHNITMLPGDMVLCKCRELIPSFSISVHH